MEELKVRFPLNKIYLVIKLRSLFCDKGSGIMWYVWHWCYKIVTLEKAGMLIENQFLVITRQLFSYKIITTLM